MPLSMVREVAPLALQESTAACPDAIVEGLALKNAITGTLGPGDGGGGAGTLTVIVTLAVTVPPPFDAVSVYAVVCEGLTVADVLPVTSPTPLLMVNVFAPLLLQESSTLCPCVTVDGL